MKHKIELYKDDAGEWRWRIRAGNGRIVAESGEGYKERRKALRPLYELLDLPEPPRRTGSYWVDGRLVVVQTGKNGHPERVAWEIHSGGFVARTVTLDVIA